MRRSFLLAFLFFTPLTANIQIDDPKGLGIPINPLDILQGEPDALVAHAVNAVTGDYVDMQTDITIPGAQQLVLQRFYNSSDDQRFKMFQAWKFNHDIRLRRKFSDEETEEVHDFLLFDSFGARVPFSPSDDSQERGVYKVEKSVFERHVTNTGSGEMSARTHLKHWYLVNSGGKYSYDVRVGSGVMYHFPDCDKKSSISKLRRSSGFNVLYTYQDDLWKTITATARADEVLSSLNFTKEREDDLRSMTVKASNGKQAKYIFKKKDHRSTKDEWFLQQVERSEAPTESYHYGWNKRLASKKQPNNNFLDIEYYRKGKNSVWGHEDEKVGSEYDGRVSKLLAPVGENNAAIPIYRFRYRLDHVECLSPPDEVSQKCYRYKIKGGYTEVFDAYDHQTNYHFNADQRLVSIEKFSGTRHRAYLYSREKFYWAKNGVLKDKGNLVRRVIQSFERVLLCKVYKYATNGNLEAERLYGNLTGTKPRRLKVDKDGHPKENDCDCFVIKRNYNNHNLVVRETHPNLPHAYEYEYDGHDQTTARYTVAGKQIRKREFFLYNTQGFLIREIVDDGELRGHDNWQGVTERHIKIYHYDLKKCPLGLPTCIEEKYREVPSGAIHLVHKVENDYWPSGQIKQERHYNNQGTLEYSLNWKYNRFGQIVEESNALGHVTTRNYHDDTGLLEWEQGPRKDIKLSYKYNAMGRVKSKEEYWDTGTTLTTTFNYNYLNQCVQSTDPHQQTTTYNYDEFGRVISTEHPQVDDEYGNPKKPIEKRDYDVFGNVIKLIDPLGYVTTAEYTLCG